MNAYSANGWNLKTTVKNYIKILSNVLCPNLTTKLIHKKYIGYYPNLKDPKTITEKLLYIKKNYRNPLMVVCADKYEVRNYLTEKGYGHLLNDLIGCYESVEDIDWDSLPDQFVLKATHGSNMMWICDDKKTLDKAACIKEMKRWLKIDYSLICNEWQYKEMKPRIVCEKFLSNGSGLDDYKIHCYNGKPTYIQCDTGRFTHHVKTYYDTNWEYSEVYETGFEEKNHLPKPEQLDELLKIAEDLSSPFPYVRVDVYLYEGKIIFGELTFFHKSGFVNYNGSDMEMARKMGDLIQLP